jgi:hypothetical protein
MYISFHEGFYICNANRAHGNDRAARGREACPVSASRAATFAAVSAKSNTAAFSTWAKERGMQRVRMVHQMTTAARRRAPARTPMITER